MGQITFDKDFEKLEVFFLFGGGRSLFLGGFGIGVEGKIVEDSDGWGRIFARATLTAVGRLALWLTVGTVQKIFAHNSLL